MEECDCHCSQKPCNELFHMFQSILLLALLIHDEKKSDLLHLCVISRWTEAFLLVKLYSCMINGWRTRESSIQTLLW